MKQLTRQEVEAVVEMLGKNVHEHLCLDAECPFDTKEEKQCVYGEKEVYIGNVLYWMQNVSCEHMDNDTFGIYCKKLYLLWEPLIFTSSLQDIISESGWEEIECIDPDCKCGSFPIRNNTCPYKIYLKSPEANALFSFLQEIL